MQKAGKQPLPVNHIHWDSAMSGDQYEIRVTGTLPPEALLDYEDLTVTVQPAETVLDGRLPDQAALNGLLARLEKFRAQVTLVRRH